MRAISPQRGSQRPDIVIAVIMAASAYLSRRESRNAPVVVVCSVVRARAPSRMSQRPDRRRRIVAVVRVKGGLVFHWV